LPRRPVEEVLKGKEPGEERLKIKILTVGWEKSGEKGSVGKNVLERIF